MSMWPACVDDGAVTADASLTAVEKTRSWVVEQLAGICSLEAISQTSLHGIVHYLAVHAFFEVDASAVSF